MFRYRYILALIVIAVIAYFGYRYLETKKTTVTVSMKNEAFEPEVLNIKKGTKVIFKNMDISAHWPASNLHPTHLIFPEFDSKKGIESVQEWGFVFNKVGNWKYHDHLFPTIKGIINVTEQNN